MKIGYYHVKFPFKFKFYEDEKTKFSKCKIEYFIVIDGQDNWMHRVEGYPIPFNSNTFVYIYHLALYISASSTMLCEKNVIEAKINWYKFISIYYFSPYILPTF